MTRYSVVRCRFGAGSVNGVRWFGGSVTNTEHRSTEVNPTHSTEP
jgi:hypothetical protein